MPAQDLTPYRRPSERQLKESAILIADDDEFFREALRSVLTKTLGSLEVLNAASFDEAMECLSRAGNVSMAFLNLTMPGLEQASRLREVREAFPDTRVAVVADSNRHKDALLALDAGAYGYIPKESGVTELAHAIEMMRSGAVYVPPSVTELPDVQEEQTPRISQSAVARRLAKTGTNLTPRQKDVLELVVKGLSNKQIARTLRLGEGTVKVHVSALFQAMGVTNRTEAAAAGARLIRAH